MGDSRKLLILRRMLKNGYVLTPALIIVKSKNRGQALHRELLYDFLNVESIFADQSNAIMHVKKKNIREGKTRIIITNNLFGFYKKKHEIKTFINFDIPNSSFDYKHCIESIDIKCFIYTFHTKEDWPALKTIASFIQAKSGSFLTGYCRHAEIYADNYLN